MQVGWRRCGWRPSRNFWICLECEPERLTQLFLTHSNHHPAHAHAGLPTWMLDRIRILLHQLAPPDLWTRGADVPPQPRRGTIVTATQKCYCRIAAKIVGLFRWGSPASRTPSIFTSSEGQYSPVGVDDRGNTYCWPARHAMAILPRHCAAAPGRSAWRGPGVSTEPGRRWSHSAIKPGSGAGHVHSGGRTPPLGKSPSIADSSPANRREGPRAPSSTRRRVAASEHRPAPG